MISSFVQYYHVNNQQTVFSKKLNQTMSKLIIISTGKSFFLTIKSSRAIKTKGERLAAEENVSQVGESM